MEAAQYLVKPVADAELFSLLDKLLEILDDEKQKYIVLVADNRTFRVMVQDIVYCESQGKRQYLYMADGTQICVRMTMTVLEELFTAYGEIVRIGKWYIITCQQYFSGHMALLHCAGTAAQSEEDGADRCRRNTKPIMHLLPNISKEIWTSL